MQHWVVKQDELKQMAAHRAVEAIESGMIVGLGTGSTTSFAVSQIAERIKSGDLANIVGIPTSIRTEKLARELDIPLATLDEQPEIDVTIDGADEVDPELNLIKGGGGALLREKVVAQASRSNIIIVDESNRVVPGTECQCTGKLHAGRTCAINQRRTTFFLAVGRLQNQGTGEHAPSAQDDQQQQPVDDRAVRLPTGEAQHALA